MFGLGSWESYAGFGSVGGLIGYVIWCERHKELAGALPVWCHAAHVVRNAVVSAFLAVLIYLVARRFEWTSDPISYVVVGVIGMLSTDFALVLLDFSRGAAIDGLRVIYRRITGRSASEDQK